MGERVRTTAGEERSSTTPPQRLGAGLPALQPRLVVGPVDDPFEREAERVAQATTGMAEPFPARFGESPLAGSLTPLISRATAVPADAPHQPDDEEGRLAQRSPSGRGLADTAGKGDTVSDDDEDEPRRAQRSPVGPTGGIASRTVERNVEAMAAGGGRRLEAETLAYFSPRFGYDFADVRVHDGSDAALTARALGARAFTVGNHIFFGTGEYRPNSAAGRLLLAHELTHTIQQTPMAARAARLMRAPVGVQRSFGGLGAAITDQVRRIAEADLPPWELLTVLIGRDPLSEKPVDRSARSLMHASLKLVPDGMAIFDDLERNKTLERTAAWFEGEVARLDLTWEKVRQLIEVAWQSLGATDIFRPAAAWALVKPIFADTVRRLLDFVAHVGARVLDTIRDAALEKVAVWAHGKPGYSLLTLLLERDPVTGDAVRRTPAAFVGAVLELVPNGDRIRENLEKSRAVDKAVEWLQEQLASLDLTWDLIRGLFSKAWDAFKAGDLLNPIGLVTKLGEIFGPHLSKLLRFASAVGKKMLELVFEGAMTLQGPIGLKVLGIVRKLGDAFDKIVADPVGFVMNLVEAVQRGFRQFGTNIWTHLKDGLVGWLVGALAGAGLVLPKVWDLRGVVDLVLQVLGITYAKLRGKLVAVVGEERVAMLERTLEFVKTLVTEGPAAAWNRIVEAVGNLWDMVIGGIKDWAVTQIVTAALTKLATMLNPAGAVVQAVIAIYDTVAFFLERFTQIAALAESVIDSISEIVDGKLAKAADYVERTMARTLPVILGFLSRLIGLGDVSGAIKDVIDAIQAKVDSAIDKIIAWLVDKARELFGGTDSKGPPSTQVAVEQTVSMSGHTHTVSATATSEAVEVKIASTPTQLYAAARAAFEAVSAERPRRPEAERTFILDRLESVMKGADEKDVLHDWEAGQRQGDFRSFLVVRVANLIRSLEPLGALGVTGLDVFLRKVPPVRMLPPEYRGGDWIRRRLYTPDGEWKAKRTEIRNRDLPRIVAMVTAANAAQDAGGMFEQLKPMYVPATAVWKSFTAADARRADLEVDHIHGIAEHWESIGHNASDSERRRVGLDNENLRLVTASFNSSREKGSYVPRVDGDFESVMAASQKLDRRIAGRFFLHADGQPLT